MVKRDQNTTGRGDATASRLIPHSSFCEEVLPRRSAHTAARMRVDRGNILASGLRQVSAHLAFRPMLDHLPSFSPPSPPGHPAIG